VVADVLIKSVNEVDRLGYRQPKQFTMKRLIEKVMQVDDTVKKNNLLLISFENTSFCFKNQLSTRRS
jgi:hypothetical protein